MQGEGPSWELMFTVTYPAPGIPLSSSFLLTHLSLTLTLQSGCYNYLHFTGEGTALARGRSTDLGARAGAPAPALSGPCSAQLPLMDRKDLRQKSSV